MDDIIQKYMSCAKEWRQMLYTFWFEVTFALRKMC